MRHYPSDDLARWASPFLKSSGSTNTMTLLDSMTRGIKEEFTYLAAEQRRVSCERPGETLRLGAAAAAVATSRC